MARIKAIKWTEWMYMLICLVPIVVFFGIVLKYALNIPFLDDYDAVLLFLIKYFDAPTIIQKFYLIFSQHNEHRIVFNKLITLSQLYLNGAVDFRQLIFIGNIGLIGIFGVLYSALGVQKNKFLFLIPVSFLLFQPQYWENIHWAMASLQNFYVIFFAFLSILLVSKKGRSFFLLGIIFAVLATFTQGNGMFVFPIGAGILLYQRKYTDFSLWLLVMLVCIGFYFNGYIQPAQHPSILKALYNPLLTLRYFFSFIGASLGFDKFFAPLIGIATLLYFLVITAKKYFKQNIVVYGFFCFLFLSALAAALTRSSFGLEQALTSRYSIISILFYIVIYLSLIEIRTSLKKYVIIFILAAITFNMYAYFINFGAIKAHHSALVKSLEQWKMNGQGLPLPDEEGANQRMINVIGKGIYKP